MKALVNDVSQWNQLNRKAEEAEGRSGEVEECRRKDRERSGKFVAGRDMSMRKSVKSGNYKFKEAKRRWKKSKET
jgi:hypothetical protein